MTIKEWQQELKKYRIKMTRGKIINLKKKLRFGGMIWYKTSKRSMYVTTKGIELVKHV